MNFWDRRGRSKCLLILVVFVLALGGSTCLTSADQDEEKSYNDEGYNKEEYIEEEIMGDMELREVERAVDALLEDDISFGEMMNNLKEGKQALDSNMLKEAFGKLLEEAVGIQKNTFIQIIFLVLLASILSNLSQVFQNQQIGEISFYMVYLLLFVMLLKTFESFAGQIEDTLNGIMTFMKALLPSYYLAMGVASGISTATVFYQMIMIIIFLSEKIILKILVPCVRIYLLMELINYLTREEFLSKLTELLKNGIIWVLKTIVGVMLGMQLVQRLISPAVDALKRTVIGKTAGAIPGVGNIFSGVTQMVLGSAVLVKNCIGAAAVIIMVLAAIVPLVSLGVSSVLYQLTAALVQPITDKRIVGCVQMMGESIALLLRLLFTVEILFLLTVAILAGTLG